MMVFEIESNPGVGFFLEALQIWIILMHYYHEACLLHFFKNIWRIFLVEILLWVYKMCALMQDGPVAAAPLPINNRQTEAQFEAIAQLLKQLSLSNAPALAAAQPIMHPANQQVDDDAPQIEEAVKNAQQQVEGPSVEKRRRMTRRVMGSVAPTTKRSLQIAGVAVPELVVEVPNDNPELQEQQAQLAAVAMPIVAPALAPVVAVMPEVALAPALAPPVLMPIVAVLPVLAPPVMLAPAPVLAAAVAQVAPILANAQSLELIGDQEDEAPVVPPKPLTRMEMRKLAKSGGWQAFTTPLPSEDWDEDEGPRGTKRRAAAKVCRAKNRYLAVALRPNLCD
jgi:hypothetical protein